MATEEEIKKAEENLTKEFELIKKDMYYLKLELGYETKIIDLLEKVHKLLEKIQELINKQPHSRYSKYNRTNDSLRYGTISDLEKLIHQLKLRLRKDEDSILIIDWEDRKEEKALRSFRRDIKLARIPNAYEHGLRFGKRLSLEKKHEEMLFDAFNQFTWLGRKMDDMGYFAGYSTPLYDIFKQLSKLFDDLRTLALKELKIMKSEKVRTKLDNY